MPIIQAPTRRVGQVARISALPEHALRAKGKRKAADSVGKVPQYASNATRMLTYETDDKSEDDADVSDTPRAKHVRLTVPGRSREIFPGYSTEPSLVSEDSFSTSQDSGDSGDIMEVESLPANTAEQPELDGELPPEPESEFDAEVSLF
jgi:hypothetical protein